MKKYQYKYTHGVGYEETQKRHMTKKQNLQEKSMYRKTNSAPLTEKKGEVM